MTGRVPLLLAALLAAPPLALAGDGLVPAGSAPPKSEAAKFDEKIGAQVPLDLKFRDENDQPITVGECVGGKPTILVMAYYRCRVNCTLAHANLVDTLRALPHDFSVGNQFNVVTLSMDPKENGSYARPFKELHTGNYGRPGVEKGWRFLTGEKDAIEQLTAAIGYKYEFDKVFKEYNHPNGFAILSPQGKVTRYFYGLDYGGEKRLEGGDTTNLRLSLVEAADGKGGSLLDKLTLACFSWDPHGKKYSPDVMKLIRLGGILTVLAVAVGLTIAFARDRRRKAVAAAAQLAERPTEGTL